MLSIILPVFNAAKALETAIAEIGKQTWKSRELIVIDGGSTDGSLDVIRKFDRQIDFWQSMPDRGIYDAMNSGIDVARGLWLYFMGVDDAFYDRQTISGIMQRIEEADDPDLVFGNVLLGRSGRLFRSKFDNRLYLRNTIHHQSAFYHRRVFRHFRYGCRSDGGVRPYQISGDYELNLGLFVSRARAERMDCIVARCADGVSQRGRLIGYLEEILIRHRHIPFPVAAVCDIQTLARFLIKQTTRRRGQGHDRHYHRQL